MAKGSPLAGATPQADGLDGLVPIPSRPWSLEQPELSWNQAQTPPLNLPPPHGGFFFGAKSQLGSHQHFVVEPFSESWSRSPFSVLRWGGGDPSLPPLEGEPRPCPRRDSRWRKDPSVQEGPSPAHALPAGAAWQPTCLHPLAGPDGWGSAAQPCPPAPLGHAKQ